MSINEILEFANQNVASYGATIRTVASGRAASLIAPQDIDAKDKAVTSSVLTYSVISIILGTMVNVLIPGRAVAAEFPVIVVFSLGYWLLFSGIAHLCCRMLAGQATFDITLKISCYVFGFVLIVASSLALIASFAGSWLDGFDLKYYANFVYYVFVGVLLFAYLPSALGIAHGLSVWRRVALTLMAPVTILVLMLAIFFAPIEGPNPQTRNIPRPESSVP